MSEQPSIFDDSFEQGLKQRRRDLMQPFLKIYLGIFTLLGAYLVYDSLDFLYKLIFVYSQSPLANFYGTRFYLLAFTKVVSSCAIVAMFLSLWMEWKWAIRFNWGVLLYFLLMTVVDHVSGRGYSIVLGVTALVLAPYYSMLYQIQQRWEKVAVSGRELKQSK